MKSRQFTKPAQKPVEDEVVESMNIVTLDMVLPEERQARAMRISEPEDRRASINNDEQNQRTLIQQTVCSCSGCMASQTIYEPQNNGTAGESTENRATRICLETALSESDQIRNMLSFLSQ